MDPSPNNYSQRQFFLNHSDVVRVRSIKRLLQWHVHFLGTSRIGHKCQDCSYQRKEIHISTFVIDRNSVRNIICTIVAFLQRFLCVYLQEKIMVPLDQGFFDRRCYPYHYFGHCMYRRSNIYHSSSYD